MPKVTLAFTEQASDLRSDEIAYKLTVENHGPIAINLLSVTPRFPKSVVQLKVTDQTLEDVRTKYDRLCAELSMLVNDHLAMYSKELREKHAQVNKEYLSDILGGIAGPAKYIMKSLQGYYQKKLEEAEIYNDALLFKVENAKQAQGLLPYFNEDDPAIQKMTQKILNIYKTKLEQICELEALMEEDPDKKWLATVEPDSIYAVMYVLRFPRSLFDANRYNIDVEVIFQEKDKTEKNVSAVSAVAMISPKPFMLTLVAVLASLLGVLLKVGMASATGTNQVFYQMAFNSLIGSAGITAVILAIVFFNIYEFTDVGKNIKMGVGWRSALLIGALCGLLGDRILNSIQAFFKS